MARGAKQNEKSTGTEPEYQVNRCDNQDSRPRTRSFNENTPSTSVKKSKLTIELISNSKSNKSGTPKTIQKQMILSPKFRMSERRRSLFKNDEISYISNEENKVVDLLDGIHPLSSEEKLKNVKSVKQFSLKKPFRENNSNSRAVRVNNKINIKEKIPRVKLSDVSKLKETILKDEKTTTRNLSTKQTGKYKKTLESETNNNEIKQFNNSIEEIVYSTDEDDDQRTRKPYSSFFSSWNIENQSHSYSSSPEFRISTKKFYSHNTEILKKNANSLNILPIVLKMIPQSTSPKNSNKIKKIKSKLNVTLANKGVNHKIRKQHSKNKHSIKSINDFLKTIKCEKLKSLPSKRISPEKIAEVHNLLKTTGNPIAMAKPLVIDCERDLISQFSDSDESDEIDSGYGNNSVNYINQRVVPLQEEFVVVEPINDSPVKAKKFFKSGHSSAKEVKITDNIKLEVSCGKLSLLSEKKKKYKNQNKTFLNEQAAVDDIIKSLNISPEKNDNLGNAMSTEYFSSSVLSSNVLEKDIIDKMNDDVSVISNALEHNICEEFRKRIPYNTVDPNEIERQYLLLDFLITNSICTEKNFEIFIADPDNHKTEADDIINNMVEIVNHDSFKPIEDISLDPYEHFRNQIPYNTNDSTKAKEQEILLDFLIENNICTEENFTIFIKELETRKDEAEDIIESVSSLMQIEKTSDKEYSNDVDTNSKKELNSEKQKLYPIFYAGKKYIPIEKKFSRDQKNKSLWRGALGQNQYQIDAGQKEFGAKQCSKCGLVYTVHEPEEEILHKEYHNSTYFLKFRGWIDEEVVGKYFEWSNDGRIIKITNAEHVKKRERFMELLKIVDNELGFASYVLPETYVAFLAVRKNQFVGLCLVQFISKANRYVKINGVDCSTEEFFDAKIGVSRIWVSPFCRRIGIASKLLLAARSHTFLGDVVEIDMVAFTSPTEDGKAFAQKISKRTDFLIY